MPILSCTSFVSSVPRGRLEWRGGRRERRGERRNEGGEGKGRERRRGEGMEKGEVNGIG